MRNIDKIFHSLSEKENYVYVPSKEADLSKINGLYIKLELLGFSMESNVFNEFNNLKRLVLYTNRIKYHSDIFRGLNNLEFLSIRGFELGGNGKSLLI